MKAKRIFFWLMAMVFVTFGISAAAQAANTDTQTVEYGVIEINEIAVADDSVSLTIEEANAGEEPESATASSTYAITTNGTGEKITAAINPAMPDGLTLKVELAAPSGASNSEVTLDPSTQDVVTGISKVVANGLTITYTLEATAEAGTTSGSTTVTFTLTDE